MKNNKTYYTVRTVLKSNRRNRGNIDTSNTHVNVHDRSLPELVQAP